MPREEIYEFIGKLALALHGQRLQVKLSSLHHILKEAGAPVAAGRGKERGVGNRVSAAYRYWERREGRTPVVANAIAWAYLDKDGTHAWANYHPDEDEV